MFKKSLAALSILFASQTMASQPELTIGVIADCQYADRADKGERLYHTCPGKLKSAVEFYNKQDIAFIAHLGDFIDKDWSSMELLTGITKNSKHPFVQVLGNHDFEVADDKKDAVPDIMDMPARYYAKKQGNWRFIIVDGNDVSLYGWPENSRRHKRNLELYKNQYMGHEKWNGALGQEQLVWLKNQLMTADRKGENVVLMSHFPVYPENVHNLWNADAIVELIQGHKSVKAWFSGHNHKGNYGLKNGIHYVTFNAMLDTKKTAHSMVDFYPNKIVIKGYGKQVSRELTW